jgi:hypothetical protein
MAQWRPCRITPAPLKDVADFVDDYRKLWERRLDRLEDYLSQLQGKKKTARRTHSLAQSGAPMSTVHHQEEEPGRR